MQTESPAAHRDGAFEHLTASCWPALILRRLLLRRRFCRAFRRRLALQRFVEGDFLAAGVHVVDVERAVSSDEKGAGGGAGELMGVLGGQICIRARADRFAGAVLYLQLGAAAHDAELFRGGVPVPGNLAARGGFGGERGSAFARVAVPYGALSARGQSR